MFFDNDLILVVYFVLFYTIEGMLGKTNWMISLSTLKMGHKPTEETLQINNVFAQNG